jgi:G3E family GTPase
MTEAVPTTVVSGPLGAGKTTLVNRLLADPGDRRIAVVVNDMGELNVDAELLAAEADEGIVDLSNGCICCRLQGDLLASVERLTAERSFDHLVVEASGISEPMPIARTLTVGTGDDDPPAGVRLDTTVSVVDAYGFWKAFDPDAALPAAAPDPERPLTEVLVDQIEFCDVLLLNKCDMVPDADLDAVERSVRELQPRAVLYRTTHCDVAPSAVLDTGLFDFEAARREQGWKRTLAAAEREGSASVSADADVADDVAADGHASVDGHDDAGAHDHDHDHGGRSAAEAHGVGSFVYRRDRPFHPDRFDAWLDDWDGSVVRMKGFAWLASRPDSVVGVSQAGPAVQAGPIGEWGDDDPGTRLVLIGRDLDEESLTAALDDCLATDAERGVDYPDDPFPREA